MIISWSTNVLTHPAQHLSSFFQVYFN
uniref:Uncharacterized protein n=1 Tax=Tetranychus urticae TaxID=32264 RepID=T1L1X3_TETUR